MDSSLRRLRRRGVTRLGLMVNVMNFRALGFYKKYGFRKLRRVEALLRETAPTAFPWRRTCKLPKLRAALVRVHGIEGYIMPADREYLLTRRRMFLLAGAGVASWLPLGAATGGLLE